MSGRALWIGQKVTGGGYQDLNRADHRALLAWTLGRDRIGQEAIGSRDRYPAEGRTMGFRSLIGKSLCPIIV